ncbi:MAG TPA: FxsA family protein [Candidatus Limnocylindrales bacterium]
MRRLRWVPLAVLLLGAAEFLVLLGVIKLIGTAPAILILVGLTVLGGVLMRNEGLRGWRRLREAARSGKPAGEEAVNSVAGLLAALLLFIPGYLTGLAGLVILVPPVRRIVGTRLRRATERRVPSHVAGDLFGPRVVRVQKKTPPGTNGKDEVIEGEIVE